MFTFFFVLHVSVILLQFCLFASSHNLSTVQVVEREVLHVLEVFLFLEDSYVEVQKEIKLD